MTLREDVLRLISEENYSGALSLIETVLAKDPNDEEALRLRGTCYVVREDWAGAIAVLEPLAQKGFPMCSMLANAYYQAGRYADAEREFTRAMEGAEGPERKGYLLGRGKARRRQGKLAEARDDLREAQDIRHRYEAALELVQVERELSGASLVDETDRPAVARAMVSLGLLEAAINAVENVPPGKRTAEHWLWLGAARSKQPDLAGASGDLMKAMSLDPSNPLPYIFRADMCLSFGTDDLKKMALADYRKAVELDPSLAAALKPRMDQCDA